MAHESVKLGALAPADAQRDAIHIAVVPLVAAEGLNPGERFGLENGKAIRNERNPIGIVDPFLAKPVEEGQRFYGCLFPNTVTSLRHEWTHPAFKPEGVRDISTSEIWLRAYAMRLKPYEEPAEAYANLLRDLRDKDLRGHGTDLWSRSDLEDEYELRKHAEIVLGSPINFEDFSFSCSC